MRKYVLLAVVSAAAGAIVARSRDFGAVTAPVFGQQLLPVRPRLDRSGEPPPSFRAAQRSAPTETAAGQPPSEWAAEEWTPEELVNIRVYERSNRSVVNITTMMARANPLWMLHAEPAQGSGSGSVLDRQGHILTNHHVIEDARSAMVTLFDGLSYPAELVGTDPTNDVAVLKIDAPAESLYPIEQGESTHLRVGQKVYAIGNPFGLERTLTVGILSSVNRSLPSKSGRTMKSILQIDAALNRGNSGGPLLDSRGRMIGMNTAIASPSGTGENTGIGFAIPVNVLRRVVPELIRNGRVIRADAGIAQVYETKYGLLVAQLVPDGPADRAGIRGFAVVREQSQRGGIVFERTYVDRHRADLIIAVDGQPAKTADDFLTLLDAHRPGEQAVLTVIRDDREVEVPIVLGQDR